MKNLLLAVVKTHPCWAALIARLTLVFVIFPHGTQKALGWFGGPGLQNVLTFFTRDLHLSPFWAWLVIATEFLAPIGLFLGLLTRISSLGIIGVMAGAIGLIHYHNGFFMNWSGQQKGEGFEYHILVLGLALVCLIAGGGKASIDSWLTSRFAKR
ncbi:MAG: hypothetical protein C5B47_05645 [Verrucomicrobia bacterium]|nr:MAG: hypothetical protein C5B47_05645 [Verrucomicrobiota bacterium]